MTSSDKSTCDSKLGRTCAANILVSSGTLSASDESVLSSWPSGESGISITAASKVKSSVLSNAGVGKLSSSSKRQFEGAPNIPILSAAGPGATPANALPHWTWRTVGVKPTGSSSPQGGQARKGGSLFGLGF